MGKRYVQRPEIKPNTCFGCVIASEGEGHPNCDKFTERCNTNDTIIIRCTKAGKTEYLVNKTKVLMGIERDG